MHEFLVVDDHALVRTGMVLTLQGLDVASVVYEACDINEALGVIRCRPGLDLVITDLRLPVIDGFAGLSVMRQLRPELRVVVITAQYTERDVEMAMARGAAGFLHKSYSSQQIAQVLQFVLAGGVYRPADHARLIAQEGVESDSALSADGTLVPHLPGVLTDRQMQVLALLVQGKPNKIICDELNLAPGTVKIHISSVLRALHVTNRTQAVLAAARLGLKL
jgi:DNA-binding NarL/FixJ family response regulator